MKTVLKEVRSFLTDILETIVLSLAIFVVVNVFVAQLHQVTGNSMLPDFHDGEYLLTDKVTYRFREPQRGEVIIFKAPDTRKDYIKRIVALPGESVKIEGGELLIYNSENPNGLVINESYLGSGVSTQGKRAIPDGTKIDIPAGNYLVLGDNREVSSDSRTWGAIPKEDIVGRSLIRLWPPNSFTFIARAEYNE